MGDNIGTRTRHKRQIRRGRRQSARRGILLDDDASGDMGNFQGAPKTLDTYFRELSDKRAKREEALSPILKALTDNIEQNFVEENFVTLLYHCLHCVKKGSATEMQQAAHIIGLLAMITSCVDHAHEAYEDVLTALSQQRKSKLKTLKILDCLAVVTFFGASNSDETEQAMQLIWNFIHPESHSNMERKHSPDVLTSAISAWSFLLTTVDGWRLSYKNWQGAIPYFSNLLDNNDEALCAAASEALALIFETNCLEKFSTEAKDSHGSIDEGGTSIKIYSTNEELKDNIIKQLRSLSTKTSNETIPVQDARTGFDAILAALKFLEEENCPNTCVTIGGQELMLSTWSQKIQLKFMKHFLGKDGFVQHMMRNENFHHVFEFMPKKRNSLSSMLYEPEREEVTVRFFRPPVLRHRDSSLLPFISREERQLQKKMTMSPNSCLSKARTQLLNKQRLLSQGERLRENDCFAVADGI
ncbi:Interferon-related developmental regulator family protein / IFRD family protein, putative [Theobroma cacao]|uniref:Interferon-related developmental regulator family protein / IFRD family protein, putative n=1 Tax=Theobroma cacao TaxID=3641 RepID=A0A061E094_THECC|nr:Interferon-related developmental regulator family protein / IFRD family protein, putative [Theobroma cacao]